MKSSRNSDGSVLVIVIAVIVVALIVAGGSYFVSHKHSATVSNSVNNQNQTTSTKTKAASSSETYAGWKTATSTRAGFSIKYPANWQFTESVRTKDNVEHIVIASDNMTVKVDSYKGQDVSNGGQPNTTCQDCNSVESSQSISVPGIGPVNLETVTYNLDNGQGNALILRKADGTYYIPSKNGTAVSTSFRAISVLDSLNAYQSETQSSFVANPDYSTAQAILKSISY